MLTASAYVHSNRLVRYAGMTAVPPVDSAQRGVHALYRFYRCRTGWIFLAAIRPGEWKRLASAVGHSDWLTDDRFAGPAARLEHDAALTAALDDVFAAHDAGYWAGVLAGARVPAVVAGDHSWNDYLADHGLVEEDHHPVFGTWWHVPPRVRFSRSASQRGGVPAIGEHSRAILAELGYDDGAITELLTQGAVSAGAG